MSHIETVRDVFAAARTISDLRRAKRLAAQLPEADQLQIADAWIAAARRISHARKRHGQVSDPGSSRVTYVRVTRLSDMRSEYIGSDGSVHDTLPGEAA